MVDFCSLDLRRKIVIFVAFFARRSELVIEAHAHTDASAASLALRVRTSESNVSFLPMHAHACAPSLFLSRWCVKGHPREQKASEDSRGRDRGG